MIDLNLFSAVLFHKAIDVGLLFYSNFCCLFFHISFIFFVQFSFQASKVTLRKISNIINAPKVNEMVQSHILEHGNLQYDHFMVSFLKLIVSE